MWLGFRVRGRCSGGWESCRCVSLLKKRELSEWEHTILHGYNTGTPHTINLRQFLRRNPPVHHHRLGRPHSAVRSSSFVIWLSFRGSLLHISDILFLIGFITDSWSWGRGRVMDCLFWSWLSAIEDSRRAEMMRGRPLGSDTRRRRGRRRRCRSLPGPGLLWEGRHHER